MPQKPARYRPPTAKPHAGATAQPSPSEVGRPTAAQRGYGYRWQQFRTSYLASNPLCVDCAKPENGGRVEQATCIDHLDSKGPNGERGYDPSNLESLCDRCHSRRTVKRSGGFGRAPQPTE
jgi:5-methylcytosine-specific restriction protein A